LEEQSLIQELDGTLPGFTEYCSSSDNLFDGGSLCGVFAACSHFVSDRPVAAESWPRLAAILNRVASGSDVPASEAACTCFLENLAEPSHPLKAFLEGEALRYWNAWETAG
jgi:hypothetical protein